MKKSISTLLIFFSVCAAFAGDGWVQPKNKGYFKLSEWWLIGDQHFTNTGEIDPNQTRATYITSIYGEYGLSNKFTAVAYFPFFTRSVAYTQKSATTGEIIQQGDAINSIGDTELSIKYGLLQKGPIFLSGTYTLGLPFGIAEGGTDGSLQTGIGTTYHMLRLDASTSFRVGKFYPFVSVNGAYNHRMERFSNEMRYGIKVGVELNKWLIILQSNGIYSFKNIENNFGDGGTTIFGNNVEYLSIMPEIAYKITDKFGLTAGVGGAFWGKLILATPSFTAGIFWTP
ncbi:MAG: hypothetical protein HC819_19780 [Cyclobacteriaceae bacterium]|nr:hypothetical protein [Cyclobacteriaceae bacterium]